MSVVCVYKSARKRNQVYKLLLEQNDYIEGFEAERFNLGRRYYISFRHPQIKRILEAIVGAEEQNVELYMSNMPDMDKTIIFRDSFLMTGVKGKELRRYKD